MTYFEYHTPTDTVYIVMMDDRHAEPDALGVFLNEDRAVDYAHALWEEATRDFGDALVNGTYESFYADAPEDWSYIGVYTEEGDKIWVIEREVE